jgi:hypothetical protein
MPRLGKTRRKGLRPKRTKKQKGGTRNPPQPGPAVCSPYAARQTNGSCLPQSFYEKLQSSKNELALNLGCDSSDERCIIDRANIPYREKKRLLDLYFRPPMPQAWKKKPDTWLNSDDIQNVMKQYEKAYPYYKFLEVAPIDFSIKDPYQEDPKKCLNDSFCKVNLAQEKKAGKNILGAIFNLDPHTKGGSHWVGLCIKIDENLVCYFDSYGFNPPPQIARFMRYLTMQNPNMTLQSNGRRFQYSNTECGMYSMYFIIRMIEGESFKKFCKKRIPDSYMLKFRNILFDPNA